MTVVITTAFHAYMTYLKLFELYEHENGKRLTKKTMIRWSIMRQAV